MATKDDRSAKYDAQLSFELLWGIREEASRGPKRGLTMDQIVTTAISIADVEGLEALSMRKVATALGYTTMSLYRYVPSKQHLLDLMVDRTSGETALPDNTMVGWRAHIGHIARGDYAMMTAHPWILTASLRPVLGPVAVAWMDAALGALDDSGLSPIEALGVVMAVDSFVRGSARDLAESRALERFSGVSQDAWWGQQVGLLDQVLTTHEYPAFQRFTEAMSDVPSGDDVAALTFEFGLERLLDGIEVFITSRMAEEEASPHHDRRA